jgi:hypothetical protein
MKMNLHLAEAITLQLGHPIEQGRVILLAWIKKRVTKRSAFVIAHGAADLSRQLAPTLKPCALRVPTHTLARLAPSRLEVVRHQNHDVLRPAIGVYTAQ